MSVNSEKGSSKADTLIKVVLVFFISLLSFTVGTFVGKQLSMSEERRMALEGQEKAERGIASTGEADHEKISEKEVESLTEEFVNKEKAGAKETGDDSQEDATEHAEHKNTPDAEGYKAVPRANVKAAATKPGAHEEHAEEVKADTHNSTKTPAVKPTAKTASKAAAHKEDGAHEAAEKVAKGEAPTDGAKETRKPTSVLPAVASSAVGKFTVQVSSYLDENEAKTHAATLKSKGWSAFYVPATIQGRTWYRVSVGIYETSKDATEARTQFMKDTNSKSALVQKIVQ